MVLGDTFGFELAIHRLDQREKQLGRNGDDMNKPRFCFWKNKIVIAPEYCAANSIQVGCFHAIAHHIAERLGPVESYRT
jgi:hypothetical protein